MNARALVAALVMVQANAQDPLVREALDARDARWHDVQAIADGVRAGAARFDGRTAHLDVGPCGLSSDQPFTLRCALRTQSPGFATVLMARDGEAVAASLTLGREPGVLAFEAWSWRTVKLRTQKRVDDGAWHRVEVAYDPDTDTARLVLDGVEQALAELGDGGAPGATLRLGDNIGIAQPFAGDLDDVEVLAITHDRDALRAHAPVLTRAQRASALAGLRARLLPKRTPSLAADRAAGWPARAAAVREHLRDCLGLQPPPPVDALDVQVHGERVRDGVRVQRVSWVGFPGQRATGWLWTPEHPPAGKRPAVLNPHGHWRHGAREDVVQARLAAFAKFGWTALAVDSVHVEHVASGVSAIGAMVWHDLRGLRLLQERADVDRARIAVTGASGGGQQTYYLMALTDELAAAAPMVMACYFAAIVDDTSAHCGCNHPPRVAAGTDVIEMCACFAGKPAMFGSVRGDWTRDFPREGLPELLAHWQRLGAAPPRSRHANEGHNYDRPMREAVYGFLHDALLGPTSEGAPRAAVAEPPFAPFPPDELAQLAANGPPNALAAKAMADEFLERRPRIDDLAALCPGLDLTIPTRAIAWRDDERAAWRRGTVIGSDGVPIPLRMRAGDGDWTLVVDPEGALHAQRAHHAEGAPIVCVDPRPYGEWAPFRAAWQRNGLLLGRGEGYQAAVDVALVAANLPGDRAVHVVGHGEAGVVAVLAAYLCPRIRSVRADLGATFAADGNRAPLCPELLRWRDVPELVAALPDGVWQGSPVQSR